MKEKKRKEEDFEWMNYFDLFFLNPFYLFYIFYVKLNNFKVTFCLAFFSSLLLA